MILPSWKVRTFNISIYGKNTNFYGGSSFAPAVFRVPYFKQFGLDSFRYDISNYHFATCP